MDELRGSLEYLEGGGWIVALVRLSGEKPIEVARVRTTLWKHKGVQEAFDAMLAAALRGTAQAVCLEAGVKLQSVAIYDE